MAKLLVHFLRMIAVEAAARVTNPGSYQRHTSETHLEMLTEHWGSGTS